MSVLRDVRLLIARHLDLPIPIRASIVEVLNLLDSSLDNEGYEPTKEIEVALQKLERLILDDATDVDLPEEDTAEDDEDEYIDLDDIEFEEDEEDDDDSE